MGIVLGNKFILWKIEVNLNPGSSKSTPLGSRMAAMPTTPLPWRITTCPPRKPINMISINSIISAPSPRRKETASTRNPNLSVTQITALNWINSIWCKLKPILPSSGSSISSLPNSTTISFNRGNNKPTMAENSNIRTPPTGMPAFSPKITKANQNYKELNLHNIRVLEADILWTRRRKVGRLWRRIWSMMRRSKLLWIIYLRIMVIILLRGGGSVIRRPSPSKRSLRYSSLILHQHIGSIIRLRRLLMSFKSNLRMKNVLTLLARGKSVEIRPIMRCMMARKDPRLI